MQDQLQSPDPPLILNIIVYAVYLLISLYSVLPVCRLFLHYSLQLMHLVLRNTDVTTPTEKDKSAIEPNQSMQEKPQAAWALFRSHWEACSAPRVEWGSMPIYLQNLSLLPAFQALGFALVTSLLPCLAPLKNS